LPGLGPENLPAYLKQDPAPIREAIIKWLIETEHHLLGRTWRAFYTKPDTSKRKALKGNVNLTRYRVFFFAEDGVRFRYGRHSGELDPRILDRPQMSVRDLIEWLMPAKMNEKQLGLKFFARLAIGLTPSKT